MVECNDCVHYPICSHYKDHRHDCSFFMNDKNTVEVVLCKDCKHFDKDKALRPGGIWCGYWGTDPEPSDFCCKGERREGE